MNGYDPSGYSQDYAQTLKTVGQVAGVAIVGALLQVNYCYFAWVIGLVTGQTPVCGIGYSLPRRNNPGIIIPIEIDFTKIGGKSGDSASPGDGNTPPDPQDPIPAWEVITYTGITLCLLICPIVVDKLLPSPEPSPSEQPQPKPKPTPPPDEEDCDPATDPECEERDKKIHISFGFQRGDSLLSDFTSALNGKFSQEDIHARAYWYAQWGEGGANITTEDRIFNNFRLALEDALGAVRSGKVTEIHFNLGQVKRFYQTYTEFADAGEQYGYTPEYLTAYELHLVRREFCGVTSFYNWQYSGVPTPDKAIHDELCGK